MDWGLAGRLFVFGFTGARFGMRLARVQWRSPYPASSLILSGGTKLRAG